jgi:hypothetical protein
MSKTNESESAKHNEADAYPKVSLHEFLVDFLGALVPGILFLAVATCAMVPPANAIVSALSGSTLSKTFAQAARDFVPKTANTPNTIWIGLFIFGLLLSYIFGHLFYRRDPKEPNQRSFRLVKRTAPNDAKLLEIYGITDAAFVEKYKCTRLEDWLKKSLACINEDDCEFPYPYLADYLQERGHDHLLPLVPWRDGRRFRSKTFINRLKIRLQFHHPEKFRFVVRNEAHVRLATSMWYVGRALWKASFVGISLLLIALAIVLRRKSFPDVPAALEWLTPPFMLVAVVFVFGKYCQTTIARFIHYQRLREVFYVLELAYTAFRDDPDKLSSPPITLSTFAAEKLAAQHPSVSARK